MSALPLIDPATATGPVADMLAAVQRGLGVTPNMTTAMAEHVAHLSADVALNVLTNYFNKAAEVDIDFPAVAV